jgi:hypothetical protein
MIDISYEFEGRFLNRNDENRETRKNFWLESNRIMDAYISFNKMEGKFCQIELKKVRKKLNKEIKEHNKELEQMELRKMEIEAERRQKEKMEIETNEFEYPIIVLANEDIIKALHKALAERTQGEKQVSSKLPIDSTSQLILNENIEIIDDENMEHVKRKRKKANDNDSIKKKRNKTPLKR